MLVNIRIQQSIGFLVARDALQHCASYSAGCQQKSSCMLQHVWWLITLWLYVSRACQQLWPHEVQEHLGMSGDMDGGWGGPRPICLPGTATRRSASILCHPKYTHIHTPHTHTGTVDSSYLQGLCGPKMCTLITWHTTLWGTVIRQGDVLGLHISDNNNQGL